MRRSVPIACYLCYYASGISVFSIFISANRFYFFVSDDRTIALCSCTVTSWGRARVSDARASPPKLFHLVTDNRDNENDTVKQLIPIGI